MTIRVLAGCLVLLALGSPTFAQELKPTVEVRAEYLMSIESLLGSRAPVGQRAVVNVTGGSVRGPNIKGEIVAPAGDWLFVMPDGSNRLDVRFTIKTDGNEMIFVDYGGVIVFRR